MSQNKQIADYLNKGKKLTTLDALSKFGCFRLASRISDLRNEGMNIVTKTIKLENKKQIAQYSIK
jgi:sulfur transfer protein SufE